jgi:hypothetical protein
LGKDLHWIERRKKKETGKVIWSPHWLAGYVANLAEKTGWSFNFIMHELPIAAGFHLLDYHSSLAGRPLYWASAREKEIDSL